MFTQRHCLQGVDNGKLKAQIELVKIWKVQVKLFTILNLIY